jgi:hypothetical protein
MTLPLMPKATAVWLVENTSLSFDQIGEFCGLHALEVQAIADGEAAAVTRAASIAHPSNVIFMVPPCRVASSTLGRKHAGRVRGATWSVGWKSASAAGTEKEGFEPSMETFIPITP